jgi:hypothetical protein
MPCEKAIRGEPIEADWRNYGKRHPRSADKNCQGPPTLRGKHVRNSYQERGLAGWACGAGQRSLIRLSPIASQKQGAPDPVRMDRLVAPSKPIEGNGIEEVFP